MPTTLNFVAAVGRTGDGANAARPRIESVCAKYRGKVIPGGDGSSVDPIKAVFEDAAQASLAAKEAFGLDDVEDVRVDGLTDETDESNMKNAPTNETLQGSAPTADDIESYKAGYRAGMAKTPAPATADKAFVQGYDHGLKLKVPLYEGEGLPKAERPVSENISESMTGHDAHMEVHVKPGGDADLVQKHIIAAHHAVGAQLDHHDVIVNTENHHPIHDYQPPEWTGQHQKGHNVIHTMSAHFTDPDDTDGIHRAVKHLRNSPAAPHISAIRVVHDYIADNIGPMKPAPTSDVRAESATTRDLASAVAEGKMDAAAALDALLK